MLWNKIASKSQQFNSILHEVFSITYSEWKEGRMLEKKAKDNFAEV